MSATEDPMTDEPQKRAGASDWEDAEGDRQAADEESHAGAGQ